MSFVLVCVSPFTAVSMTLKVCATVWTSSLFRCVHPLIRAVLSEKVPPCLVLPRALFYLTALLMVLFQPKGKTQNIHSQYSQRAQISVVCSDQNLPHRFYQLFVSSSNPNGGSELQKSPRFSFLSAKLHITVIPFVCSSGLLLQESNKFSEALHYYKLAIGSRPTLACKYSSSFFIDNLQLLWLWLCCVQATGNTGCGYVEGEKQVAKGSEYTAELNIHHSCVTDEQSQEMSTDQATA